MGLPLICQDTVSDVSDGETYRPRSLASILHDVKCSKSAETLILLLSQIQKALTELSLLMPLQIFLHFSNLTISSLKSCPYLSSSGLVMLDPDAISV